MFLVLFFVYFLSLHPWDMHMCVSVVYLYYFYLCTPGHVLYVCLRGFFLLFYFLFFAPQQPVSTSRHTLQTPRHMFQTPGSLFWPPMTPTHMFWPSMAPSHAFTGTPGPEMHIRAIICAFLLLFIFFGFGNMCTSSRTCVSDVFIYFILIYSTWDTCMIARTHVSHILFIGNVWITTKVLAGTFE